ncbi:hypothetical protein GCM10009801_02730 [Streptomyces albiaxialis]|uniref:Uncharacterized protein n=1 Tax=Streptomyces albiaxialis TaxID=329523 RepID=A0ABN2VF05_9ACTN
MSRSGSSAGSVRHRIEQGVLCSLAGAGICVSVADILGLVDGMDTRTLSKVTLLILGGVTLFLVVEIHGLKALDDVKDQVTRLDASVNQQLSKLDMDALARELREEHFGGVVRAYPRFPDDRFAEFLDAAREEVTILQTWIPNLDLFQEKLAQALVQREVRLRVLLLKPSSPVADLRYRALARDPALSEDVRANVEHCLATFAALVRRLPESCCPRVEVRVYNSLPSLAVYKADERYLVSSFLHGRLAIHSSQTEIEGRDTAMGRQVQEELNTLWDIGLPVQLPDWRDSPHL